MYKDTIIFSACRVMFDPAFAIILLRYFTPLFRTVERAVACAGLFHFWLCLLEQHLNEAIDPQILRPAVSRCWVTHHFSLPGSETQAATARFIRIHQQSPKIHHKNPKLHPKRWTRLKEFRHWRKQNPSFFWASGQGYKGGSASGCWKLSFLGGNKTRSLLVDWEWDSQLMDCENRQDIR